MIILKSFAVAFSMYSRIPMPRFKWDERDMRYHLIFFPLVGAVIGGLLKLWKVFDSYLSFNSLLFSGVVVALPLLITGGFHLDGFIDTSDALSSYKDREERLKIMKDPHVGAFGIIRTIILVVLFLAFVSCLQNEERAFTAFLFSFFISRTLSALSVVLFKKAREDGMAKKEADTKGKVVVVFILILELIASSALCIYLTGEYGIVSIAISILFLLFYRSRTLSLFGGITGDTQGWFLCVSECLFSGSLAALTIVGRFL